MAYLNDTQIVSRSDSAAIDMPTEVGKDVVKAMEAESVVMRLGRKVAMSSKSYRQPMISGLPTASWVNALSGGSTDTGLKSQTTVKFGGATLTAEPVAALVVIPDDFFDDSMVPLWDEVKPLVAEAIGRKIDDAALWNINRPASWTDSVYTNAVAAGNYVNLGQNKGMVPGTAGSDLAQDVAMTALQVSQDGFNPTGFAYKNGLQWEVLGARTSTGEALFTTLAGEYSGPGMYGLPAVESRNGAWKAGVHAVAGDWDKAIVGIRQDVSYTIHTDAVITDAAGAVIFNAMQQDSKIMRVVARIGFAIANPQTQQNTTSSRSPFSILLNNGTAGS